MKKDKSILLGIFLMFIALMIGVFIGRNTGMSIYEIPHSETAINADAQEDVRLDINVLSAAQLKELPGIGEQLAQRIVAYREANGPFQTMEEVMNVEGIGEKKLAQIATLVKVGG